MSTYSKLRDLQYKYQMKLNHQEESGYDDAYVQLLEDIVKDLSEAATDASWDEFPEDMGR